MQPLTPKQRAILDFLTEHIQAHAYAPSLLEIGARFQLRAVATVHKHLTTLEHKGYIKRQWNKARGITVIDPSTCPMCGQPKPMRELQEMRADSETTQGH